MRCVVTLGVAGLLLAPQAGAAPESKERIARLSACQSSGAPKLQMHQGTLGPSRAP